MSNVPDELSVDSRGKETYIYRQMIQVNTRAAYDLQLMRMQMGSRVIAGFKAKLGIEPGTSEKELDENDKESLEILKSIRLSYAKMTDGVKVRIRKFKGDNVIENAAEFSMVESYMMLEEAEEKAFKNLEFLVEGHPIYPFLKTVHGCGPKMMGVLISEIDISKAKYSSSLHRYAGLDVIIVEDDETNELVGIGRSRRKELMSEVEYIDKEGNVKTKKTLGYNPWLKTKLIGVLAVSMLRAGGKYYNIYLSKKFFYQNHPRYVNHTKAHIHAMSIRYMIKMFLNDLYMEWRRVEGYEVYPHYHESKLGLYHGKDISVDNPEGLPLIKLETNKNGIPLNINLPNEIKRVHVTKHKEKEKA